MAAPAPEPPSGGLLAELTPFERTFVLKQRSMEVISGFLFPFQGSAWLQSYLDLCGGDTGRMRGCARLRSLRASLTRCVSGSCRSASSWRDISSASTSVSLSVC